MTDVVYTSLHLSDAHAAMLRESGISPDVAAARGYRTIEQADDPELASFAETQRRVPLLHLPGHDVFGERLPGQVRPEDPREVSRGSRVTTLKYESALGSGAYLDVPPTVRDRLLNTMETIVVTEGVKKADSAVSAGLLCVALPGVWSWRGKGAGSEATSAIPAFERIPMRGRDVIIAFDGDVTSKVEVRRALRRLTSYLRMFHAELRIAILPETIEGAR